MIKRTGKIFDHPFGFVCNIPTRARYRAVHAALGLASRMHEPGKKGTGTGCLDATKRSDRIEYRGHSKDALEVLLRTLEMPDHRKILKAPTTNWFTM